MAFRALKTILLNQNKTKSFSIEDQLWGNRRNNSPNVLPSSLICVQGSTLAPIVVRWRISFRVTVLLKTTSIPSLKISFAKKKKSSAKCAKRKSVKKSKAAFSLLSCRQEDMVIVCCLQDPSNNSYRIRCASRRPSDRRENRKWKSRSSLKSHLYSMVPI
jgi:hypothetical protein